MAIEPITRKEKFMAKAGGQQVGDLKPITREEMFLSKIGGGGESYDLDIFQLDHQGPTLLSGDYNTVKTKILNREFVKVRYRHVHGQSNSYDYPVFCVMYDEEDEEIEISCFDSDTSGVYERCLYLKPDNRFD